MAKKDVPVYLQGIISSYLDNRKLLFEAAGAKEELVFLKRPARLCSGAHTMEYSV